MLSEGRHPLRSSEGLASSLRSFKGWIQTEACIIPSYRGRNRETNRDIISVAVVPSKQKLFVQPKLNNNNVRLIRYNCSTRL